MSDSMYEKLKDNAYFPYFDVKKKHDMKDLSREECMQIVWNGMRQILVFEGLMAKYSQNPDLGEKLKATGDALLAEAAVRDHIWGIGLSMRDPKRLNQRLWNGQNLLGYATMLVRDRI